MMIADTLYSERIVQCQRPRAEIFKIESIAQDGHSCIPWAGAPSRFEISAPPATERSAEAKCIIDIDGGLYYSG